MKTARLTLRRWREQDRAPLSAMNADPEVMRHFPAILSRAESDIALDRMEAHFAEHGFGLWAVECNDTGQFIGCAGLIVREWETAFTPCVEIGWRFARAHWGRGFATEAAGAVVEHAFTVHAVDELIAVTAPANTASRRVMEKLGFTHNAQDDFYDPRLPAGHPLRPLVLYRKRRPVLNAAVLP